MEFESGELKSATQRGLERANEPKQEESSEVKMETAGELKKEAPTETPSNAQVVAEKLKMMDLDINSQSNDADKIAEIGKKMGLNVSKSIEEKQAKVDELKMTRGKIEIPDNPEGELKTAQEIAAEKTGKIAEKEKPTEVPEKAEEPEVATFGSREFEKTEEKNEENREDSLIIPEEKPKEEIIDSESSEKVEEKQEESENAEKIKVCAKCGKENRSGNNFCTSCGNKFGGEQTVKEAENLNELSPEEKAARTNERIKKMMEKARETKPLPEDRFSKVKNFEELYKEIRKEKEIIGSGAILKPERQIKIIESVRNGEFGLDFVTRAGGLREKVEELINKERNEKFIASLGKLLDSMQTKTTPLINTFKKFASFLTKERHFGGSKGKKETSPIQDMEAFVKEEKAEKDKENPTGSKSPEKTEKKSEPEVVTFGSRELEKENQENSNVINIEDIRKKKKSQEKKAKAKKAFRMTGGKTEKRSA